MNLNESRVGVRAVLYTDDMEPITVLELAAWARDYLEQQGIVRLHVLEPLPIALLLQPEEAMKYPLRIVTIRAERFVRKERSHLMLFTQDDENAMLLRAAFLPGQLGRVKDERAKAFAKGFLEALNVLGFGGGL